MAKRGIKRAAKRFHRRKIKPSILPKVGKADLHIHSDHSDGKHHIEEILDYIDEKTNLDVIAITDHDTIKGSLLAQKLARKNGYNFEVIVGEEITAKEGHVLGLFLKEFIPPGLPVKETIEKIKNQGGIAVAVHPLYKAKIKSKKFITADGVGALHLIKSDFDAVETINATPTFESKNLEADYINKAILFKPELGGSDAHILAAIGKGYTFFPGTNAVDLRAAISSRKTGAMRDSWHFIGLLKYFRFFMIYFVFGHVKKVLESIYYIETE